MSYYTMDDEFPPLYAYVAVAVGIIAFVIVKHHLHIQTDSQSEVARLTRELAHKEETITNLYREVQSKEWSLNATREEYNKSERRITSLETELRRTTDENARLQKTQAELESLRFKHAQAASLLESRATELKAAEVFLGKADKVSGADVAGLLNTLNSEIFQTAAQLAEAFQVKGRVATGPGEEEVNNARESLSGGEILGADLLNALAGTINHEDPIICQIALQVSMCILCQRLIASWSFGQSSDSEQLLGRVHEKLRMSEEQAISGRWRAMTRKYAKEVSSSKVTPGTSIQESFANILLVAGYTGSTSQIQETIAAKFSTDIDAVVQAAQRVKQAIGEEVTSCELKMIHVAGGKKYKSSTMTADGKAKEGEKVAGTIELGLLRSEKQGSEIKEAIILKPKVQYSQFRSG